MTQEIQEIRVRGQWEVLVCCSFVFLYGWRTYFGVLIFWPCDPEKIWSSKVLWIPKEKAFGTLQPTQRTVYQSTFSDGLCSTGSLYPFHRCSNACDKDKEKDKEKDEKEKEEQEKETDKLLVHISCDSNSCAFPIAHSPWTFCPKLQQLLSKWHNSNMFPGAEQILILFSQRQGQGGANVWFFPHLSLVSLFFLCFIFARYLEIQMLAWLATIPIHHCILLLLFIFKFMLWLNFLSAFINRTV